MKDLKNPKQKECPNCNRNLSMVFGEIEPSEEDISVCCHCGIFLSITPEGFQIVEDSAVIQSDEEREAIWEMRNTILRKSRFYSFIGEICMN